MARWKLCAWTIFEILQLSTWTMCQLTSYISKGIQPIFENFASARSCWGLAFGWNVSGAQMFYFCNARVMLGASTTFEIPTFNHYTVPAKIVSLQMYSTDFRKRCFSSKMLRVAIWGKVSDAQVSYFCNGKAKTLRFDTIWNFPLSTCTLCQLKSYICKGIQPIFVNLASARRCWGWAFGWNVSSAEVFYFCNGKVKTFRIDNIWNFPLSTITLCQLKSYISKSIQPIFFETFDSSRWCWGWDFGCKVSDAQVFYFCKGKVKPLRIENIWILPLSTCRLCELKFNISKGIHTIFENFASARRCWGLAFGGNISGAQIFYFCNGKVMTLRIDNISNFPLSTCTMYQLKSYISKAIQPIFENVASARRCWGWPFGEKFHMRRYLIFAMARRKLCASTQFEISPLSTCTLCQLKSYICKGIQPIFVNLASARRCWGWAFGWNVSSAEVFYFCNGKVKTFRIDNIWNFPLSTITLCQLKSYISKSIQQIFFETFDSSRWCWGWDFGCKVSDAQVFYFCKGKVKPLRIDDIWILPLSTCRLCELKFNISKGIHTIFENFASARRCWGLAFGGNISGAQIFYFCNGKVMTLRIDNISNFPLSTCTMYLLKSYISKAIQPIFENVASARRCWGWPFGEKFQMRRYLIFAMARRKLCASTQFEISHFQPVHCAS